VIKLDDYPASVLKFLKSNEMAAVFVFSVAERAPCKVGHLLNLKHRFDTVQEGCPDPITIEHLAWCPSAATASLLAEDVRHRLGASGAYGHGGWWNVEPLVAISAVRKACAMFPSRGIVTHVVLMQQLACAGFAA
jgi:hypothetical protein